MLNKSIWLSGLFLLSGCAQLLIPKPPAPLYQTDKTVDLIPSFEETPHFIHEGNYSKADVAKYTDKLRAYMLTMTVWLNNINERHDLTATRYNFGAIREAECDVRFIPKKIPLPPVPALNNLDNVENELIDHISALRQLIRRYNDEVDRYTRQVNKECTIEKTLQKLRAEQTKAAAKPTTKKKSTKAKAAELK